MRMENPCFTHTSESASALVPNLSSDTFRWFDSWRKINWEELRDFLNPEKHYADDTNEIYRLQ